MSTPIMLMHQGVEYHLTGMSLRKGLAGGKMEEWFYAFRPDEGDQADAVWICDGHPGEFVRVFVPRDQAKDMIEAG